MLKNSVKVFLFSLLAGSLLTVNLTGCSEREKVRDISLQERDILDIKQELTKEMPLHIAVGSMITPEEGFAYYKQLLDYIGEKINKPVDFIDKDSYAEVNKLLGTGDIDMAFVCGRPYVDGRENSELELLVAPQVKGQTVYYSYIIVPVDSPAKRLDDLKGKTFAFADPMSNSGKLAPTYMLALRNQTPDSFFSKYIYTSAHDKTIKVVAQKIVDGGAVDSLIWDYENAVNPKHTSQTRIIDRSGPHGIPPVVVRVGMDPQMKEKLKQVLLDVHKDEKGRQILAGMKIDKFVVVDDKQYDSIRQMKDVVLRQERSR